MAQQVFIIGIGGTGMRCIESFIHLCAMGMFDDTEVHMLALDTDRYNGNFERLRTLKGAYHNIKGFNKTHYTQKDTFFSANIHYYEFSPDDKKSTTFEQLFKYGDTKSKTPEKSAIADLLLTEAAINFDLKHGYRAQTHLGSILMYHAIIDSVTSDAKSDIKDFVSMLISASKSDKPRIFIMGSVFGGTGASSIPVIPKAINDSAQAISDATSISSNAYYGATLLTNYFTFQIPNKSEIGKQKVVATSDKFALNSQAALMFYEADSTVKKTYQRFYLLGTDTVDWQPSKIKDQTVTGGGKQENDSHYIELLAAFAAHDFFKTDESIFADQKKYEIPEYLYRTFNDDDKIDFADFAGSETRKEFAKKFGMLLALSYITLLDNYDFFIKAQVGDLNKLGIKGYDDIEAEEVRKLKKYMELFHFKKTNGDISDGWVRQLYRSAGGGEKFVFNAKIFGSSTEKEFENFKFNDSLYQKGGDFEKNAFKHGIFGSINDTYISEFIKQEKHTGEDITNKCEKLIKISYKTLCKLYKF